MMFKIDRNESGTLCDQIAEGFRKAIALGEYKPGDRLPQMRELAAHFGVSIRVVVRAFAKLETERLVAGRRGVGCVVMKPPTSFWKGQIVVIVPGGDYVYCQNIRAGVVCDRLSVRGYLMQRVTVPAFKRRVYDFRSLDLLLRQDTSLVVMVGSQPEIERHLAASNVRYLIAGSLRIHRRVSGDGRGAGALRGWREDSRGCQVRYDCERRQRTCPEKRRGSYRIRPVQERAAHC